MKTITSLKTYGILLITIALYSCIDTDADLELGDLEQPANIEIQTTVSDTGDGKVTFSAKADNAVYYHYYFGNSSVEDAFISTDGNAVNAYECDGTNTYTARVVVFGKAGLSAEKEVKVTVRRESDIPSEISQFLTGGGQRCWKWKQSEPGHIGLGEEFDAAGATNYDANYYEAAADEKAADGCLYEDLMTFSTGTSGCTLSYVLDNSSGSTLFRQEAVNTALGEPQPNSDRCYAYSTEGTKDVSFKRISEAVQGVTTGVQMNFSGGGFMSFYLGSSAYEILSITDDELRVRVIQEHKTADSKGRFTWYHTFEKADCPKSNTPTSSKPCENISNTTTTSACSAGGRTGKTPNGDMTTLVWSDEFNQDGAPCSKNWNYDIGTGQNGWGNNESQYYTKRSKNVIVEDGMLKIRAIKESYQGSSYTSARLKSEGAYDFKYGKAVIRAKIPEGGGTWPAIWMLGSNFSTVSWPDCGEIDIMEHVGNNQNVVHSTLHYPGHSGGGGVGKKTNVPTASSAFHEYEVRWDASNIKFYVDGTLFHNFSNNNSIPFNHNFFMILNVAMGGGFGGSIANDFSCSTMEIDYVRVYQ